MIISPPLLPVSGLPSALECRADQTDSTDPMMDAVDKLELHHGIYPITFDGRWHCGVHLTPKWQNDTVRAIADGEVIAYRVSQEAIADGQENPNDGSKILNSNTGFVLLKHSTDTGEGRTITFYSLYMHLLDLASIPSVAGPLPNNPPEVGSSMVLPKWLSYPTDGVEVPQNRTVRRRDILGYCGACHGKDHLHFEIFMTEEDFTDWFERQGHVVQLGGANPVTPPSKDYWGHSYYVIPAGQTFVSVPPGLPAAYFPALLEGTLGRGRKLYVEAYFHRGQRYTRSWLEENGTITSLTASPVRDPYDDYEYKLYDRATTLYPSCPSDGYEMLRFGRLLRNRPTPPDFRTWVAVTFETGKMGYIDINQPSVEKLSDADFPSFMGWQKITEGNTPFDRDGICDYEELQKLVAEVEKSETAVERALPKYAHETILSRYVLNNKAVREKLRGFVCHAPSEWDASRNEARYGRLKEPDGFFGKRKDIDPNGYDNFIRFKEKLQFFGQTPLGGEKKFWFFHPLAFIRHFRKCTWLSNVEIGKMFPPTALRRKSALQWVSERVRPKAENIRDFGVELNKSMRKYGIATPHRQAAFFGNATQETQWFNLLEEGSGGNQRYSPWVGRGFLQLTWPDNYLKYWRFSGQKVDNALANRLHDAARTSDKARDNAALRAAETHMPADMIAWRNNVTTEAFDATDSAGAYWAWSHAARPADEWPVLVRESKQVGNTHKSFYRSESFGKVAATVNIGRPSSNFSAINGLQARYQAYTTAIVILMDGIRFPGRDGTQNEIPDL